MMLTLLCPRFRCAQPMEEDRVFAADMAFAHVAKRRFVCVVCRHDLVIEPDPASPRFIITEPWIGYRFIAEPLEE